MKKEIMSKSDKLVKRKLSRPGKASFILGMISLVFILITVIENIYHSVTDFGYFTLPASSYTLVPITIILGLIGFPLGILAWLKAKKLNSNKVLAIIGTVISGLIILVVILFLIINAYQNQATEHKYHYQNQLKYQDVTKLSVALLTYREANDINSISVDNLFATLTKLELELDFYEPGSIKLFLKPPALVDPPNTPYYLSDRLRIPLSHELHIFINTTCKSQKMAKPLPNRYSQDVLIDSVIPQAIAVVYKFEISHFRLICQQL